MCAGDTLSRCRKDIFAEPSSDMLLLPWHDTISGAGCDGFFICCFILFYIYHFIFSYLLFHCLKYLFHFFIFTVFIFAEPSSDMLLLPWHDTISDDGYAEIIVVANMVENFDIYEVEIFAKCQL